jgi:ABC-type lipoprotein release transport system permease subunit
VTALDPVIFTLTPFLFAAVAVVAAFFPALKATGVNPVQALNDGAST